MPALGRAISFLVPDLMKCAVADLDNRALRSVILELRGILDDGAYAGSPFEVALKACEDEQLLRLKKSGQFGGLSAGTDAGWTLLLSDAVPEEIAEYRDTSFGDDSGSILVYQRDKFPYIYKIEINGCNTTDLYMVDMLPGLHLGISWRKGRLSLTTMLD